MKKTILAGLGALLLLSAAPLAWADWYPGQPESWQTGTDWRPGIYDRIRSIRARIAVGIDRRELTRGEAERLYGELDRIRWELDAMKSDGYLSSGERDRVVHDLERLSRQVWVMKNNDQGVPQQSWQAGTDWRPGIYDRIRHIRARIAVGIDRGELTRGEAQRLYGELDRIRWELDAMKSDGYLSGGERNRVLRDLQNLGRHVSFLKNNDYYR